MEKFIGFFTSRPFWAINGIDFENPVSDTTINSFTDLMSEIVYDISSSAFSFRVCRDGMLLLQIQDLENKLPANEIRDIQETVSWWGEYLDYFNCLYLLLDSAVLKVENLAYFDITEVTNKDAFRISFEGKK